MATKLDDDDREYGPHILSASSDTVRFEVRSFSADISVDVKKADFIAAVETELNGIFISRDDLPEVVMEKSGWNLYVGGTLYSASVEAHRELALRHLAAAEYLKKNPPVDQKQVDALAQILADNESWPVQDRHKDVARKILASGKVTVND